MVTASADSQTAQPLASRVALWFAAAVPIAAAIAVDPAGYQPFGPARYLAVPVLLFAALAALIVGRRRLAVGRVAAFCWVGLVAWLALAAAIGVDHFHGWVGLPERRLGVVAWVIFGAAYVVGGSLDGRGRHVVVRTSVVALTAIGLWAVLEGLGAAPIDLGAATTRLGGPFGSAAFLAAACSLLIPLAAGVALDTDTGRSWRSLATVAVGVGMVALAGSGTRAGWVGVAVAAIVTALARHLTRRRGAERAASGRTPPSAGADDTAGDDRSDLPQPHANSSARRMVAAVIAVGIAGFAVGGWVLPESERPQDAVGRQAGSARLDEWRVAARVIADRPLVGAGPEGYRIVAGAHIDADYERQYGRRVLPDRAHNGLLDVGAAGGLPAVALFGVLIVAIIVPAVRVMRRGPPWLAGAAAGLVGYVAQQQFLFPLAEIDPWFWLVAGAVTTGTVAAARTSPTRSPTGTVAAARTSPTRSPTGTIRLPRGLAAIPALALLGVAWFGMREVLADRHLARFVDAAGRADTELARTEAQAALDLRPDILRVRIAAARMAAAPGDPAALRAAIVMLDGALEWSPRDPLVLAERATLLSTLARSDRSVVPAAAAQWEAIADDDPNNARVLLELGIARVVAGNRQGAETAWRRAAELAPSRVEALVNLVRLYDEAGRTADARAALSEAERRQPTDPDVRAAAAALAS